MSRNRLFVDAVLDPGGSGLFLDHSFRWHGELAQFSARMTPAPTTSEFLILTKTNAAAPDLDVIVRLFDLEGLTDLICNDVFQFKLGDHLEVTYPNTDNITIGFQAVLREVG